MIGRDRAWFGRCVRIVSADYDFRMPQTTSVEIDTALLERLREHRPGRSDRELLESVVLIALGRETLRSVQERSDLTEEEAIELGVKVVHEARRCRVSPPPRG
jgi:hypothetical protein